MTVRLEHANLLVRDIDEMIRFLRAAVPGLLVRGGGGTGADRRVHLGNDGLYFALEQATSEPAEPWTPYAGKPGTNRLGIEVDDAEGVRDRLHAAGYRDTTYPNTHPHRTRVYFRDGEGNDWEFVEYRSSDPARRHDYGYGVVDEALERLAGYGPDLANGMTSHAPMVVEALAALGRPDAVQPWLERYAGSLLPAPVPRERIERAAWRSALSRESRYGDWRVFFRDELRGQSWEEVLERWVARLAPGFCAAALHGVIRLGHATRSLGVIETEPRLRELADALAAWASTYQELPVTPLTDARGSEETFAPRQAIERVAVLPPQRRRFSGTIVSALTGLDAWPAFAPAIGLVDVSGDPEAGACELADTFARVYLANARDELTSLVFLHGVTSMAAVVNLLPHLEGGTAHRLLRYAWQASAGLYAAFATQPVDSLEIEPAAADWDALVERAVTHGDEHAIKFAEAARRLDTRAPSPAYAAAVSHAIRTLPQPGPAAAPR